MVSNKSQLFTNKAAITKTWSHSNSSETRWQWHFNNQIWTLETTSLSTPKNNYQEYEGEALFGSTKIVLEEWSIREPTLPFRSTSSPSTHRGSLKPGSAILACPLYLATWPSDRTALSGRWLQDIFTMRKKLWYWLPRWSPCAEKITLIQVRLIKVQNPTTPSSSG